jgi:hypothetical protein
MSETSDEENMLTPEELKKTVKDAELSFLPVKSRDKYIKAYNLFTDWRQEKGANTFSETVLLSYFIELSQTRQPSTMWSIYSMLKATIKTKNNVHIETYPKLISFLKRNAVGHKSKKSKIFTASNIEIFLNEAPDCDFLAAKVSMIFTRNICAKTTLFYYNYNISYSPLHSADTIVTTSQHFDNNQTRIKNIYKYL